MSQTQANAGSEAQARQADAADLIAAHLARTSYPDLPAAVVSAVKISILDTLGCIIAGTSSADVATISSMALAWGGAPVCTVIGSGGVRLPPISAAFINGAAIHQHDFDDVHDAFTCHPTAPSSRHLRRPRKGKAPRAAI
jgi:2-methylcitrate dehydratase PrpD